MRKLLKIPGLLVAVGLTLGIGQSASAQQLPNDDVKTRLDRLEKQTQERIEQLEKQNRDLQETLKKMQPVPTSPVSGYRQPTGALPTSAEQGLGKDDVQKIVGDVLKAREDQARAACAAAKHEEECDGYKVGTALGMTVSWNNGLFFATKNKDFIMHVGGWFQNDAQWWNNKQGLKAAPPAGVGEFVDGDGWRRIRIQMDGTFWEVCDFNCIYALENNTSGPVTTTDTVVNKAGKDAKVVTGVGTFNQIGLDEFWFGVNKLPIIGTIRFGHQKVPQGLEGDQMSSSRVMMFEERASYCDAFFLNFATGLRFQNTYADERVAYQFMWYRPDLPNLNTATSFQDGTYGYTGRIAALPIWCDDGRRLLHVAASGTYRINPFQPGPLANGSARGVQLRARAELRDSDADNDTGVVGGNGNRIVDTGLITSSSTTVIGVESAYIHGPFSVQAEWAWTTVNGASNIGAQVLNGGNYTFQGGYICASYFLTGEHRGWDKRNACFNSQYLGKDGPNTPFFAVRGEDHKLQFGLGAWELCARYSYLNLNNGQGATAITGGIMNGFNAGVNWHLNNNLKVQFDYIWDGRNDTAANVNPGNVSAFVIRTQLMW